ncbi:hypothetical protein [Merismopedia glauca]|uniref:hypothetical protein n=1 Tax=Merismopedia glauca TaxID=292586 RepID=UPI001C6311C1|nr:hypothetical protein [Merismopedia glauca]
MTELKTLNPDLEDDSIEEENEDEQYEKDKLIYDPEKINIVTREPTIEQLLRRINKEELDLAPDFQLTINDGKELWNRRGQLFPNLEFCESVRK